MVKTIYVAGSFIGKTPWLTHLNASRGEEQAAKIWALGAEHVFVISPHQNSRQMVGVSSERTFVLGYLKAVDLSDALYVMGGWKQSKGTKGEIVRATEKGKPIFFHLEDVVSWARGERKLLKGQCPYCHATYDSLHGMWAIPQSLCDNCLVTAWRDARYQTDWLGNYLKTKELIP